MLVMLLDARHMRKDPMLNSLISFGLGRVAIQLLLSQVDKFCVVINGDPRSASHRCCTRSPFAMGFNDLTRLLFQ